MNGLLTRSLAALCVGLLCATGVLVYRTRDLQDKLEQTSLDLVNVKAKQDTTRMLLDGANDILREQYGDSTHGVTHLTVQEAIKRDKLDKALDQERRANVSLRASFDSLR